MKFNELYESSIDSLTEASKDTLSNKHIKTIKGFKWKPTKATGRDIYVFQTVEEEYEGDKELTVYETQNKKPFVLTYADHYQQDYGFMSFDDMDSLKSFVKGKLGIKI